MNNFLLQVRNAGVVGAGGAGFPTYKKLDSTVDFLIVNGAECEPLLDKDKEIMRLYAREIVEGVLLAAEQTKAKRTVFAIKEKNKEAIAAIKAEIQDTPIEFFPLRDVYPAGDEYELVWYVAGRQIPPGGIPLHVGCVVSNVETFYNIYFASKNMPVTQTLITVHGAVHSPKTFWAPVGMSFGEAIEIAGGTTVKDFIMIDGGPMMGKAVTNLKTPLIRTSSGILVLPAEHYLAQRKTRNDRRVKSIGKSACDQCSDCTMLCPRAQLGIPLQPHLAMRALGFSGPQNEILNKWASFCVECNICSLYACPENLDPMDVCRIAKHELKVKDIHWTQEEIKRLSTDVRPTKDFRLPPISMLTRKLGLADYAKIKAPFAEIDYQPQTVCIPLKQHIGAPAKACVKVGDEVYSGDIIGKIGDNELGVPVHASINGKITAVDTAISIQRMF
jgi:Na+-translocating ferredoxin:NAD+ oxidoreductase RnfC subunit